MSVAALLLDLHRRGVTLDADGDQLRCRGPKSVLTSDMLAEVKAQKNGLLDLAYGRIEPRPSILSLAKDYRRRHGDGFREAFIEITGCDFFETTPSWVQLFIFDAHLRASAPGTSDGGQ